MTTSLASPCPDNATWLRMLNQQVQDSEATVLSSHLEECQDCCLRLEGLFEELEPGQELEPGYPALDATTLQMLSGLASDPARVIKTRKVADQKLPEIPGLTNFQPPIPPACKPASLTTYKPTIPPACQPVSLPA